MNAVLTKALEVLIGKLLSYLGEWLIDFLDSKRDNRDIDNAFENENEGGVASDLNDVFNR